MKRAFAVLCLMAVTLSACGDDEAGGPNYDLRTPADYLRAEPAPVTGARKTVDRQVTAVDLKRVRPVIEEWAKAVRRRDFDGASRYLQLPAIVSKPGKGPYEIRNEAVATAFNASLSCGAKLITTKPDGRYVVATFVLIDRSADEPCSTPNQLARVGFVFGDRTRPLRFTEWWQIEDGDRRTGPPARPSAPPASTATFL